MSTRATVHFQEDNETKAIVYRHSDGYPDGLGEDLKVFFREVQEQTKDCRFGDPTYLAAKFVVWQAERYTKKEKHLDFLGIGVIMGDPGDIEYRYLLACDTVNPPVVEVEKC